MLKEENDLLTQVGPGTPCGEMLRRYWWPVEASDNITAKSVPIRLMGEDLVLFRDGSGALGIVTKHCAHRRSSLEFGRVEEHGIRCFYHGWLFDVNGKCLEQPAEPEGSTLKDQVRQKAYHAHEAGGLVFAYIGPAPVPVFPKVDLLFQNDRRRRVWGRDVHNSWLQQSENGCDPYHIMTVHASAYPDIGLKPPKVSWTEAPTGITNTSVYPDGRVDVFSLYFPSAVRANVQRVGAEPSQYLIYNVPIDDTHTVAWWLWCSETDAEPHIVTAEPYQRTKPGVFRRVEDDWFGIATEAQDDAAISSQGIITDRTQEFLGTSDLGIVMYRRQLMCAIEAVKVGQDPQGVLRPGQPGADDIIHIASKKTGFGTNPGEVYDPALGAALRVVPAWERDKLYEKT